MSNNMPPGMPGMPPGMMPQPLQINADITRDFMMAVLKTLIQGMLTQETQQELFKAVVSDMEKHIIANVDELKKNPKLMQLRIDGSFDRLTRELIAQSHMIANSFYGDELFTDVESLVNGENAEGASDEAGDGETSSGLIITG